MVPVLNKYLFTFSKFKNNLVGLLKEQCKMLEHDDKSHNK